MSDVFISYSRRDFDFVRRLADGLSAAGKDVWLDLEGMRDAERFPEALEAAIQAADALLFVISPDSVASSYCERELVHAASLNKRLIPVRLAAVDDTAVPEDVRFLNWIPVEDPREPPVPRVLAALDADLGWEKQHTRLTVKALEWERSDRDRSFLLHGSDLAAAEEWLAAGAGKDPGPTESEADYLLAARRAVTGRQRSVISISLAMLVLAVGLLVYAVISREQAVNASQTNRARELAAYSKQELSANPDASVILAAKAVQTKPIYGTQGSMFALRAALDASHLVGYVPPAAFNGTCSVPGQTAASGASAPTLAQSPDGSLLAEAVCSERVVRIIRASDSRILRSLPLGGTGDELVFLADHELVVDPDGRLEVMSTETGRILRRGPRCDAEGIASLDARAGEVAFPQSTDVCLWNLRTDASRRLALAHTVSSAPSQVAFAPDGRDLAVSTATVYGAAAGAPPVQIIDVATGRRIAALPNPDDAGAASFSGAGVSYNPDGRQIAVAEIDFTTHGGTVALRGAQTLAPRRVLVDSSSNVPAAAAFSPDGSAVAYDYAGDRGGLVSTSGQVIVPFVGATEPGQQLTVSPNGGMVTEVTATGAIYRWSTAALAAGTVHAAGGLPGGLSLWATPGGFVIGGIINANTVVAERFNSAGRQLGRTLRLTHASFGDLGGEWVSPDGRLVAVQLQNPAHPLAPQSIRIWNLSNGRALTSVPPTVPASTLNAYNLSEFVDGDRQIATAVVRPDGGNRLELIDVRTGRVHVLEVPACHAELGSQPFSYSAATNRLAVAGGCGPRDVHVYSLTTDQPVGARLVLGSDVAMALSPNGQLLAGVANDGIVTVVDVGTGHTLFAVQTNQEGVESLAFSSSGRYLAAAGLNGTVQIFDAHSGTPLRVIPEGAQIDEVAFPPTGDVIDTLNDANLADVFQACPACESPRQLLELASRRMPLPLTPAERGEFDVPR